jgi:Spy/CpxP family protein refolding chaperone
MFKTKHFLFTVLSLFVLTASFSIAQEKKVFKFKKGEPPKWEMKGDLNLTDDQRKQFDDLDLQHEKKMIDLRADLEKSKLMKRELINKGSFSKNDYLSAEEKIMQAENKIHMEKAKLKMDKYSLLDENQKKNFLEERDHKFMFNLDMDGIHDGLKILKERMHGLAPCLPEMDEIERDIEREIEVEIRDNEI